MKKINYLAPALLIATIVSCTPPQVMQSQEAPLPAQKTITISSEPAGAKVVYQGEVVGTTPCQVTIPLTYRINTQTSATQQARIKEVQDMNSHTFLFVKDGYGQEEDVYKPQVNDPAYPRGWIYPAVFRHVFKKPYVDDPTIRAGEATTIVNRDRPGQTALERTIIRWFFDSEPRGARIFWRVISSIPDQVKNTNELYLSSTPYEETRSFNILGLTYENSRDVTIEIKVTANGYMDQVKRYNVRQAIDQQEISGFFDLVKKL